MSVIGAYPSTMMTGYMQPEEEGSAIMVGSLGSVPVPSIEGMPPGTLLIRTVVTSICGSDLSGQPCADCDVGAWRGFTQEMPRGGFVDNQPGNEPFSVGPPVPGGSGHELMGEIAAYVEPCDVNVGDRVLAMSAGWAMAINRKEFETRTGVSSRVLLPVTSGGFLEYFVSTVDCIVPVPPPPRPSFNPLWYVAAQPFGTIIKAAAKLDSVLTKTVCIMGQGQNGLMMTSLIKSMGAKRVVVCDLFQNRLDIAEAMGATHTINCTGLDRAATVAAIREIVGGHPTRDPTGGADVCIDMAGHQGETLAILGDVAARSGKMLIFGLPPHEDSRFTGRNGIIGQGRTIGDGSFVGNTNSDMSISYAHLTKNLTYMTAHISNAADEYDRPMEVFELAMDMLADGRIDVEPLMTHSYPSTEFPKAYENASNYEDDVIKTLVVWNDDGLDAPGAAPPSGGVAAAGAAGVSAAPSELFCRPCKYQPTKL